MKICVKKFSLKKTGFILTYVTCVFILSYLIGQILNPDQLVMNQYHNDFIKKPDIPTFLQKAPLNWANNLDHTKAKHFRGGIKRQGHYTTKIFKPQKSHTTKSVVVNYGTHNASKSSPIESESFIIVAGDQGLIQILNKKNLNLHWKIQLFDSNLGIHSTPVTFSDYMIVGDYSGKIYLFDLKNKKMIWVSDWGDAIGASPLLIGKFLYINVEKSDLPNGFIAKINIANATIKWVTPYLGEQSHSSPASDGEHLYFGNNDGMFFKMAMSDGHTLWTKKFAKPIKSTPVIVNDLIIFSGWDGYLNALDTENGQLVWSLFLSSEINQSSVAVSSNLQTGVINTSDGITVFDTQTGSIIKKFDLKMTKVNQIASPIIVENNGIENAITSCKKKYICIVNLSNLSLTTIELNTENGFSNQVTPIGDKLYIIPNKEGPLEYIKLKR